MDIIKESQFIGTEYINGYQNGKNPTIFYTKKGIQEKLSYCLEMDADTIVYVYWLGVRDGFHERTTLG